jgi:hypothetical protein
LKGTPVLVGYGDTPVLVNLEIRQFWWAMEIRLFWWAWRYVFSGGLEDTPVLIGLEESAGLLYTGSIAARRCQAVVANPLEGIF